LILKRVLNFLDIYRAAGDIVFDGHRGRHAGALSGDGATYHAADRSVGYIVPGHTASGHQQVLNCIEFYV
jgi:hypothetical protein